MTVTELFVELAERGASLKRPRYAGKAGWCVTIVCDPLGVEEDVAGVDPEDCALTALRLLDARASARSRSEGIELGEAGA